MNEKVRITSEVVRVRGHFLLKLVDYQWALAKHGIAAGESEDLESIRIHMEAARSDLAFIMEGGRTLGFDQLANHAEQIRHMMGLFLERCLHSPNCHKPLTDVILELNDFVSACKALTEQPTVLQDITLPNARDIGRV